MAIIKPFKAVRPAENLAEKVAGLPYDVMTSDEARVMTKGNPHSFLHVDKSEIDLDPSMNIYDEKVYEKAASNLDELIKNETLIRENSNMLYIYKLTRNGVSQTGLVACTSVDEYLQDKIKKHEFTREDKERDRIKHVEVCDANTGPIFLTYNAEATIDEVISSWTQNNKPLYDFVAEDGVSHTVWAIDCKETINKLQTLFKDVKSLYIADGHHRNASAVKVALKKRAENPNYTGEEEFNFYLSVIFPDNQLNILDYNRVVSTLNGNTKEEFLEKVSKKFNVELVGQKQFKPQKALEYGMYIDKNWYKLTAREELYKNKGVIETLDVSILQDNLLTEILGVGDPRTDKTIDFIGGIRGLDELEKRVNNGEAVAFALHPTSMADLIKVADSGQVMPPKSTWFEPKLRSGLFIHELETRKRV